MDGSSLLATPLLYDGVYVEVRWTVSPLCVEVHVTEIGGKVVACGALEIFTEDLGEARSLVVDEAHERHGLGRLMVERIIDEARRIGLTCLMALTYVPAFFHKLDFQTASVDTLPEKVWGVCVKRYKCNNCDEIAVLKELKS